MLLEKRIIFNTTDVESYRKLIEAKCSFKEILFGIYFFRDNSDTMFDGKYRDGELHLYYKGIKRNVFNPIIIINYFDNNFEIKIKYNTPNKVAIFIVTLIFLFFGIIGVSKSLLSFLPLIVFWILILVSFEWCSRKIISVFNRLHKTVDGSTS